jgi:hypothetical protein
MSAFALAILLLPAAIAAGAGAGEPGRAGAELGHAARPGLRLALSSDRPAYAAGQPVTLTLVVENAGPAPVVVTAPSGQLYDFAVRKGDRDVWRWSADRAFPMQLTEWTLAPGERRVFSETWRPAPGTPAPGDYTAEATLAGGHLLGAEPVHLPLPVR